MKLYHGYQYGKRWERMMVDHKWISIEELSEYLGISAVTIRSWILGSVREKIFRLSGLAVNGAFGLKRLMNGLNPEEVNSYDSLKMAADSYRMINAGHKRIGPASFMHS